MWFLAPAFLAQILLPCRRRSSFTNVFCPKSFVHPILCLRTEGVFPGVFQSESSERKVGCELAVDFLILQHESGSRILLETGTNFVTHFVTNFVTNFVPKSPRIFQAFFPCPKKFHAQIHATFGAKIHANFGNFFLNGFSGCSTLVCFTAFGCQYVYADQRRLVS